MVLQQSTATMPGAAGDKLARLREEMPAVAVTGYFNAGTNGPLPRVVHEAIANASSRDLTQGRIGPNLYPGMMADSQSVRDLFADIFHADPVEVALTRSTSEGLNIALAGMTWRPGDEILTVQLEHVCLFAAMGLTAHRHGAVIKIVDIGNGGGDVVAQLEAAISPRTRAIAISHVQWSSGAVMPLKEIATMARARGILTLVDAAQAAGQIAVDFHDLGVDAYAIAGQKWLCGPNGSGALFVRNDAIGQIQPTYLRYGAFDPYGFVMPPEGAKRYEMGETFNPAVQGQAAGLRWLRDEVEFDWLTARVKKLGRQCHEGLSKIDGVTITTPVHNMAGLVCFTVEGKAVKDVSDAVYKRGHTIRFVDQRPGPAAVRISTGWWCTEDEVDSLVAAITEVARS
jgi:L-cysteine/cystine lyase